MKKQHFYLIGALVCSVLVFSSTALAYSLRAQLRRIDQAIEAKKTMILVLNRSNANPVRLEPRFEQDLGRAPVEVVYLASEETPLEGDEDPIYLKTKDLMVLRLLPSGSFHYVFLAPLSREEAESPGSYKISSSPLLIYQEIKRLLWEYGHFYRGIGPVEKELIYRRMGAAEGASENQILGLAFVSLRQQFVNQGIFTMDSGCGWSDRTTPFPLLGSDGEPLMSYFTFVTGAK